VIASKVPLSKIEMQSGTVETLPIENQFSMEQGVLYDFGGFRMVLSRFFPAAILQPSSVPDEMGAELPNAVAFQVDHGGNSHQLIAYGKPGIQGEPAVLNLGNLTLALQYGSLPIKLPFSLRLNRFVLDRYPGSQSPSAYTSKVTLVDDEKNVNREDAIFMNNILNYRGYRFFQSSYDVDEKGTILSVNHDAAGTIITYIGYFLMSLGMFWALFARKTRFRALMNKAEQINNQRKKIALLLMLILPLSASAQLINTPPSPDKLVAEKFGAIWVQDNGGRIKPLNSLHQEIVIKLVKHNSFHDLTADQIVLGMLTYPAEWQTMPMITVKDPQLRTMLGITGKKAAFTDFFTSDRQYKIHEWVDEAYRENPSSRNKLEQEIIKIDEQVNVFYMAQMGSLHKLFPSPKNLNLPWYALDAQTQTLSARDSLFVSSVMGRIVNHIRQGNNPAAIDEMDGIIRYQESHSDEILPSLTYLKLELLYNKLNVFLWLATFFFILGSVLLLLQFIALLKPAFYFRWLMVGGNALLFGGFLYYCFGLALRWVVSGHAPWSNGYESMIFIGWTIFLAGILMSRKSNLVLPITGLFTGVVLMVAHLSWMNPEITNLVPVLKSYWLTLHVSVITGGYGFLALGALLGFLNLLFTSIKTKSNHIRMQLTIDELTAINEITITAGLYLMTIGSFLGGVWANESWGRYWGWDPKETWSLITIVLYAFVVHMRLIPGMKGFVAFNTASLITFASVIMTYLGVNYYLTGLHSYGSGDPVPIPTFVYYTIGIVLVLIFVARYNQSRFENDATTTPN
jgi:cytochrome c-type biogenesis protein CcsB